MKKWVQNISPWTLLRDFFKARSFLLYLVITTLLLTILIEILSLFHGVNDYFQYFFLIPMFLAILTFPKKGMVFTFVTGWIYIILVCIFGSLSIRVIAIHMAWFFTYITLGVVFSSYIEKTRARTEEAEQIKMSLAEKEILLKEIHHRVKNNLQIVSSLLNMHIRKIHDPLAIAALQDSQNRVMSMALIHEHLYKGKNLASIDLMDYVSALGTELFAVFETEKHGIRFDLNIHNVYVDINTAIPLGLIVNELITNSLKHAFREQEDCRISVTASKNPGGLTLIIADNGVGIAGDITLEDQNSLGLRLVRALTRQLHGTVTIDRTEGTKFTFAFPPAAEIKTEVLL